MVLTISITINAQSDFRSGAALGITATFGTKINRIGLVAGGYITNGYLQANMYFNAFHAFNSFGPDLKRKEMQINLGLLAAFGPSFTHSGPEFFMPAINHTGRSYALTYIYKIYLDNIETSQNTGLFGIHAGGFSFVMENDIFIFKGDDKWRTGAFSIGFRRDSIRVAVTTELWTGNQRDPKAKRFLPDSTRYASRFGYTDLSDAKYGKYSHGILTIDGGVALPFHQHAGARIGLDAEQVRHVVQNKLIHDMLFIPKKWIKVINPHLPMLDEEGRPYLGKENQRINKPKFFGNVSANPLQFY
jgi:hypothetical protein